MIFVKESESYRGQLCPVAFLNLIAARFFSATSLSISLNLTSFLCKDSYKRLDARRTPRYAVISEIFPFNFTDFWLPVMYLIDSMIILCLFISTLLLV